MILLVLLVNTYSPTAVLTSFKAVICVHVSETPGKGRHRESVPRPTKGLQRGKKGTVLHEKRANRPNKSLKNSGGKKGSTYRELAAD